MTDLAGAGRGTGHESDRSTGGARGRVRLAEFLALYGLAPVAGAVLLPANAMFAMLFAVTAVGLVLLGRTPGFAWSDLARGWGRIDWRLVLGLGLLTAAVGLAVIAATAPGAAFGLVRAQPGLMLTILILYPLVSALPQEIIFRVLYFRRYGALLPGGGPGLVLNAAVFALAHLMYWSGLVALMTFAGGLAFAHAYERRRSLPTAVAAHALAGNVIFLVGLGIHFYSGNVVRPF